MFATWLSVAGRIGIACACGGLVALAQGAPDVAFAALLIWIGAALGVFLTLVVDP